MTNYMLAKIILLAGGIQSRKRIQKTVHLLQAGGCPLGVLDYRIHHYGPYSKSLATLLDEMSSSGLLIETESGQQYDYEVNPDAEASLASFEKTPGGFSRRTNIEQYQTLLEMLCDTPARTLELASTIVGFLEAGNSWENAVKETSAFKREADGSTLMDQAAELAASIVRDSHGES